MEQLSWITRKNLIFYTWWFTWWSGRNCKSLAGKFSLISHIHQLLDSTLYKQNSLKVWQGITLWKAPRAMFFYMEMKNWEGRFRKLQERWHKIVKQNGKLGYTSVWTNLCWTQNENVCLYTHNIKISIKNVIYWHKILGWRYLVSLKRWVNLSLFALKRLTTLNLTISDDNTMGIPLINSMKYCKFLTYNILPKSGFQKLSKQCAEPRHFTVEWLFMFRKVIKYINCCDVVPTVYILKRSLFFRIFCRLLGAFYNSQTLFARFFIHLFIHYCYNISFVCWYYYDLCRDLTANFISQLI